MSVVTARRIVDVLESEMRPLDRGELGDRSGLGERALESALHFLRGQQVVQYDAERDVFRISAWANQATCAFCDERVDGREYYDLELRGQAAAGETLTGSLHERCVNDFLQEVRLEPAE
jgi:hypothetical protein